MEQLTVIINNRISIVRPHSTVLQACEAAGVTVPRFCYYEKLSVAGNCRRCLVEVFKSPKPVVSCAMPVAKGMVIFTDTPLVRKAREAVLEFLLLNHPLDCPICDQAGECDLQDESLTYGSDRGRYFEFKRSVQDKECGPIVKTIRTRCIHCTRCIRFASEISGYDSLGAFGRGEEMEIGTYIHSFIRTELSGNLVDLCPVGALTSKPYAYQARSWELKRVDTLDFFDSMCSDISVQTRNRTVSRYTKTQVQALSREDILRILPGTSGLYTENWISDRTRYAFDGLQYSRGIYPMNKQANGSFNQVHWLDTLQKVSFLDQLSNPNTLWFKVGSHTNLEIAYSIIAFAKRLGTSNIFQGVSPINIQVDAPFFFSLNRSVNLFMEGSFNSVFLIGTNLRYEASLLNTILRREQVQRSLSYVSIGAFGSLRYSHYHQGNSFRSLLSLLENRLFKVKSFVAGMATPVILTGVERFRTTNAHFLQVLIRNLGKKFFVKTKNNDRLGWIHSSVGSLAFAYLGVKSPFISKEKSKKIVSLFTFFDSVSSHSFFTKNKYVPDFFINFDTHSIMANGTSNVFIPLTSLYEREGYQYVAEGRIRKHSKAVSTVGQVRNLETVFGFFSNFLSYSTKFAWIESNSNFSKEIPWTHMEESTPVSFNFNPFTFESNIRVFNKLTVFHQTVRDFYLQEPVAAYSPVRAECSLFFSNDGNFSIERLLFIIIFFFIILKY